MLLAKLFTKKGVLGMNARNLLYIRPYNRSAAVQFADSKLKTKLFLRARGVPVPKLLLTIHNKRELANIDWKALGKSFVVKPNRGFGGEGILIERNFSPLHEERITQIKNHILDIFDGNYSLSNVPDFALVEQVIMPGPELADLSFGGLPDIRVIVHNLVPVMAMLRLPTTISQGKSNVHQGGIGVGIDLSSGETTHAVQYNKLVKTLVDKKLSLSGIKIPNWDEILLIASKCQLISNLGFMAADIALDKNNRPVVLELNARAGLMIQIANLAPLRERLERVRGLKVSSPEKGVLIAKELFGAKSKKQKDSQVLGRQILGPEEGVELILPKNKERWPVLAKLDPSQRDSLLDRETARLAGLPHDKEQLRLKFILGGQRLSTVVQLTDLSQNWHKLLLGRRDLKDFLIDPARERTLPNISLQGNDYHEIDEILFTIDKQLKLLSHLQPLNLNEERKKFLKNQNYNPSFRYRAQQGDLAILKANLAQLRVDDTALGQLFSTKRRELQTKIQLLEAVGNAELVTAAALELYGEPDTEVFQAALERLKSMPQQFPTEQTLDLLQVMDALKQALQEYGLRDWNVSLKKDLAVDIAVGKQQNIFLSPEACFTPTRLTGTIAHEIETHILRTENGKQQPYKIFQRGLAGYLGTEEGLAIYNQERYLGASEHEKYYWAAGSVVAVKYALNYSFEETFQALRKIGFGPERAFMMTFKVKRGLKNTGKPGAFTKNYLYFAGRLAVEEFLQDGGDLKQLYLGKIGIKDLPKLALIPELKTPLYLPSFLQR